MILDSIIMQICAAVIFLTAVVLHIAKKNSTEIIVYGVQSVAIISLLILSLVENFSLSLLAVIATMFVIKVILTPVFFVRLIKTYKAKFTDSSFLGTTSTMVVIASILPLIGSSVFGPLIKIAPEHEIYLLLSLAAIFISMFFIINQKSVMSQSIGVLSMENSIVAFAIFAGLEQSPLLQLGTIFDMTVWVILAVIFVGMIFRHFGALDTTNMNNLKG
jgi:hydrogenase-4 component E